MESGAVGHNFEMGLPKDYPSQIWYLFLNCSAKLKHVWLGQPRPPFKMTAVTKSRNFCFITHQNELKFYLKVGHQKINSNF
jgi:hypothetical protein